jgi:CRP-like cAMP-binding protein
MDEKAQASHQLLYCNRLLAVLPAAERDVIEPHLEAIDLPIRMDPYLPNEPISHVYFPCKGVASMTTPMKEGPTIELATVGPEGMVGVHVFLGTDRTSNRALIQVAGDGGRMTVDAFRAVIPRMPHFARLLQRYTLALLTQIAQNSACNRTHSVEERCARWLLMTRDRVQDDSFLLTQEFIAQMLGVRRPTVSIAAGMLSRAGFITYVRGRIRILDPEGLERAACECYRIITAEFARLLGPESARSR